MTNASCCRPNMEIIEGFGHQVVQHQNLITKILFRKRDYLIAYAPSAGSRPFGIALWVYGAAVCVFAAFLFCFVACS